VKVAHLTTVDLSLRFLLLGQLKALRDEGHDVIGISRPGPWIADLEREGIRHITLESSTRATDVLADFRSASELWRVLRRERPHVLHTHTPKPGLYGRIIGRVAGVPIVVNTVHGLYATPDDHWRKRLTVYLLEAAAARFSDAELVQNPEDFDFMRRSRITRRARLIGNGVDLQRFDPARFTRANRHSMRTAMGARSEQVVIGTVGRLVAEKGYPELFDAMTRLNRDDYLLVVIGAEDPEKPDALPKDFMANAQAWGVRFLGHRDDVDALYAAMDLFVLASHREGYPRAAMEAAAMGLPVVATDIRGCRQVVEPGHNGLLVPTRDATALAGAIRKLGDAPSMRAQMGKAAQALARTRFDERRVADVVIQTYREIAARKTVSVEPVDVLQVISSNDRRGPESHALDLGGALASHGRTVRAAALAPGRHGRGLDVPTLGRRPLALGTLRRLRREAAVAGVVVAHGSTSLPACACALMGTGVPFVYRSIGDPRQWARTPLRRARVRAYLCRANAVVALTSEAAAMIQTMYGVSDERISVIPVGVPVGRHEPVDDAERRAARAQFGIPADADAGAIIGALSPEKDVSLAIDAAASIPKFHLIVAGDGPDREALERRAALSAPGRVHFAGSLRDPAPAFAAADLLLLTSRTEGLPAVLIEAALREMPVVATDVGYVREIVIDGKTGVIVKHRDRSEVRSAIARVLSARGKLGRAGRSHCLPRFDLEHVAASWNLLLDQVRARSEGAPSFEKPKPPTLRPAGVGKAASSARRAGPEVS
jgi:glycosyltransferase involved in cell wall biosynthesis